MVQAHSPEAFFPLSNQRVTLRSQIQLQVYFYGQCGQHLWFCLGVRVQPNVFRSSPTNLAHTSKGHLLTQSGQSDILIIRFMKKTSITVTEASRNFADCVNRAHYQNVTFVLLKNGEPVARLVPDNERVCVGRDLAEALAKNDLPENEARAWHRDLEAARKSLKAPVDKWR